MILFDPKVDEVARVALDVLLSGGVDVEIALRRLVEQLNESKEVKRLVFSVTGKSRGPAVGELFIKIDTNRPAVVVGGSNQRVYLYHPQTDIQSACYLDALPPIQGARYRMPKPEETEQYDEEVTKTMKLFGLRRGV